MLWWYIYFLGLDGYVRIRWNKAKAERSADVEKKFD